MMRTAKTIVTCTSTPERLEYLFYTVTSILRQSLRPDAICINLSQAPRLKDDRLKNKRGSELPKCELPEWLCHELIEIRFVESLDPCRRLLPIHADVQPDDLIITIDDDVIYHREWIARMVAAAERYPNAIICGNAKIISNNAWGRWKSYGHWPRVRHVCYAFWILPVGGSGIAYRTSLLCTAFLHDNFLHDKKLLRIANVNTDLWFRMASLIEGSYVYVDPRLPVGNMVLPHDKGVLQQPVTSLRSGSLLRRLALKLKFAVVGYFGAELGKNDRAWRDINEYIMKNYAMAGPFHDDIDEGPGSSIFKK